MGHIKSSQRNDAAFFAAQRPGNVGKLDKTAAEKYYVQVDTNALVDIAEKGNAHAQFHVGYMRKFNKTSLQTRLSGPLRYRLRCF